MAVRVSPHDCAHLVRFLDNHPRSSTGKIRMRAINEHIGVQS